MLSDKETAIMDVLWEAGKPMTSMEIVPLIPPNTWGPKSDVNIHRIIKSLLQKGLIRVCGQVLTGKLYARQFEPAMTREEYTIQAYSKRPWRGDSFAAVAIGMVQAAKDKDEPVSEEFIQKLKDVVAELRTRDKKDKKEESREDKVENSEE